MGEGKKKDEEGGKVGGARSQGVSPADVERYFSSLPPHELPFSLPLGHSLLFLSLLFFTLSASHFTYFTRIRLNI